jgi:hypothetical protein
MQKFARIFVLAIVAASFVGYAGSADAAAKPRKPAAKPSSYAPGPSNQRVYGAPIQGPIVASASSRTQRARADFRKLKPCPSTGKSSGDCPGYTMAYKTPLNGGGANAAGNLHWKPTQVATSSKPKTAQP